MHYLQLVRSILALPTDNFVRNAKMLSYVSFRSPVILHIENSFGWGQKLGSERAPQLLSIRSNLGRNRRVVFASKMKCIT